MLPTFVIGLREGLEAALIVGIIAAFLRKQGRRDLVRWVFVGVGAAVLVCLGVGVALKVVAEDLPQRQQEGLETVIGIIAVGMVTYMVVWMRRHSRELKGQLEGLAAGALARGSSRAGRAMVAMAFLAVLREGFETVVFLLAAFNESGSGAAAGAGAVLGIGVAAVLGYGIYRGGVRINLAKFFRATGLVLVLVAAGLVVNALRTAHEAGWLTVGQAGTVDLTWLVQPGSVQASLLTGMLGIQAHPVVAEVVGWFAYLIPVGCYVAWPAGRRVSGPRLGRVLLGAGAAAGTAAVVLALVAPGQPPANPTTAAGSVTARMVSYDGGVGVLRTQRQSPAAQSAASTQPSDIAVRRTGTQTRAGVPVDVYTATLPGRAAARLPRTLDYQRIVELNGGRLPIGLRATPSGTAPVRYADADQVTAWVAPGTGRVVDLRWSESVSVRVIAPSAGPITLAEPIAAASSNLPAASVHAAGVAARADSSRLSRSDALTAVAWGCGVVAALSLVATGAVFWASRRRPPASVAEATETVELAAG